MAKTSGEKQDARSLTDLMSLLSNDHENTYPGGASEEEIKELEEELGTGLPSQYSQFLKRLGGGNFKHVRLYSIASEDENFSDFMEQITVCNQWIPPVLSGDLLPFGDDYGDNVFCFDLSHAREGEYEIVLWGHEFQEDYEPEHIAYSFSDFLEKTEFKDS